MTLCIHNINTNNRAMYNSIMFGNIQIITSYKSCLTEFFLCVHYNDKHREETEKDVLMRNFADRIKIALQV